MEDKQTKIKNNRITLGIIIFIFLSIAFPLYFYGCDKSFQNSCIFYKITRTTVVDYKIGMHICKRCVKHEIIHHSRGHDEKKCIKHELYQCYTAHAIEKYKFNKKNETCVFDKVTNADLNTTIVNVKREYPIGSTNLRYIKKSNGHITEGQIPEGRICASIVFFCFAALFILIFVYEESKLAYKYTKINTNTIV